MKFLLSLAIVLTLLAGCMQESYPTPNPDSFVDVTNQSETTSDYRHLYILEVSETRMHIAPPMTDPTASYPSYEIHFDEDTKVEGVKDSVKVLAEGDLVEVWVRKDGPDREVAEKIIVYSQ
ncbi:hypothetical protein [Thalassobacillus hwangdonensis]|uniref:DUF3221 domain-containing protein n=1 Tax=Thalassobacillus hwangdonensis TaxID=546108 RepID=A0ABW3L609_9BACI